MVRAYFVVLPLLLAVLGILLYPALEQSTARDIASLAVAFLLFGAACVGIGSAVRKGWEAEKATNPYLRRATKTGNASELLFLDVREPSSPCRPGPAPRKVRPAQGART